MVDEANELIPPSHSSRTVAAAPRQAGRGADRWHPLTRNASAPSRMPLGAWWARSAGRSVPLRSTSNRTGQAHRSPRDRPPSLQRATEISSHGAVQSVLLQAESLSARWVACYRQSTRTRSKIRARFPSPTSRQFELRHPSAPTKYSIFNGLLPTYQNHQVNRSGDNRLSESRFRRSFRP